MGGGGNANANANAKPLIKARRIFKPAGFGIILTRYGFQHADQTIAQRVPKFASRDEAEAWVHDGLLAWWMKETAGRDATARKVTHCIKQGPEAQPPGFELTDDGGTVYFLCVVHEVMHNTGIEAVE